MPTNRTRKSRKLKQCPVSPLVWKWLNDEIDADDDPGWELFLTEDEQRSLWEMHRDEVLKHWIQKHPGSRPKLWWEFSAPQKRVKGETEREYLKKHHLLLPGEKLKK